jgi:hypothetical protein
MDVRNGNDSTVELYLWKKPNGKTQRIALDLARAYVVIIQVDKTGTPKEVLAYGQDF